MERILILGSEGQVGAYLKEYLNKKGYQVEIFERKDVKAEIRIKIGFQRYIT